MPVRTRLQRLQRDRGNRPLPLQAAQGLPRLLTPVPLHATHLGFGMEGTRVPYSISSLSNGTFLNSLPSSSDFAFTRCLPANTAVTSTSIFFRDRGGL